MNYFLSVNLKSTFLNRQLIRFQPDTLKQNSNTYFSSAYFSNECSLTFERIVLNKNT